jgi:hypothetical protein
MKCVRPFVASLALVSLTAAWAAPPDRAPKVWRIDEGGTSVKRLAVSPDQAVLVGATGSRELVLLDIDGWTTATSSRCEVYSAAVGSANASGIHLIYLGCSDGALRTLEWDGRSLSPHKDADGADETVQIAQNPLIGTWIATDGRVYGLAEATGDAQRLHDWDPVTGEMDHFGNLIELLRRDFREASFIKSAAGDMLYVAHGGNDFSQVNIGTGTTVPTVGQALSLEIDDLTPQLTGAGAPQGVLIADPDRGVVAWYGGTGLGAQQPFQILDGSLENVRAICIFTGSTGQVAESYVMQVGSRIQSFPSIAAGASASTSFEVDFRVVDLVQGPYGYLFAGTNDGELAVLTAHPWVDRLTVDPETGGDGTTVNVSFRVDRPGAWKLHLGGDRTGTGAAIASGTASEAGTVSVEVEVSEAWVEGDNKLYAVATEGGLSGHARGLFTLDNAPPKIDLDDQHVGFADSVLELDFPAADVPDVLEYKVYISTEPFAAADYPTGGPTSEADDDLETPRTVTVTEGATRVQTRIAGLDNYVVYYLAVRAIDTTGKEGPMSRVVEGMPRPTFSAGDLVNEAGGPASCATGAPAVGGRGAAIALPLLAVVGLARRRRSVGLLGLGLVVFAAPEASAQETRSRGLSRFDRDITPAWASFEFRHDFQQFGFKNTNDADLANTWDTMRDVYGPWGSLLRVEVGPQIFRVAELDFGIGFLNRKGSEVSEDGDAGSSTVRLQWMPLSLGATLRAHVLDEQPIVPYVSAGVDWVFFREDNLDADGAADKAARLVGSKNGWHWAVGGNILLDNLAPSRAARLEAMTGINDTWLVVDYRQQQVGSDAPGFDFSGWSLGIGLKLDY